jgi:hypothetical protein
MSKTIEKPEDAIKYASMTGAKLAFEDILKHLENGMSLNMLKAQLAINIDTVEKLMKEMKKVEE